MADNPPEYEALAFSSLAGVDLESVSPADLEAARARLAELAAASTDAMIAWPFDVAAFPAPVMAVLDSLAVWRASWLAYEESPGEGKDARAEARDRLAAAQVADDELADLVDALLAWRKAEYPRYARRQADRAADKAAMAPKERPETRPAKPAKVARRRGNSEATR